MQNSHSRLIRLSWTPHSETTSRRLKYRSNSRQMKWPKHLQLANLPSHLNPQFPEIRPTLLLLKIKYNKGFFNKLKSGPETNVSGPDFGLGSKRKDSLCTPFQIQGHSGQEAFLRYSWMPLFLTLDRQRSHISTANNPSAHILRKHIPFQWVSLPIRLSPP